MTRVHSRREACWDEGVTRAYPIHFSQNPFLYGERFMPGSWTISSKLVLDGAAADLEDSHILQALNQIVERHEALTYRFEPNPIPSKAEGPDLWWRTHHQIPTGRLLPRSALKRFDSVAELPPPAHFSLTRPPYLRLHLAPGDRGRLHARIDTHHAVADMWSCRILQQELVDLLTSARALPPPPPSYGELVAADHRALLSGQWGPSFRWWSDVLGDPPGHGWPGRTGAAGRAAWRTSIEGSRHAAVRGRLSEMRCTPFTLLACAYARAMARVQAWEELTLFVLWSNRRPAAMRTVGQFANIVYLPVRPSAAGSLDDLVKSVGPLVREMLGRHGHVSMWDVTTGLDEDAAARVRGAPQVAIRELLTLPRASEADRSDGSADDPGQVTVRSAPQASRAHNLEADVLLDFASDAAGLHLRLSHDRSLVTDDDARQVLADIATALTHR